MKNAPGSSIRDEVPLAKSLTRLLGQSEHVKDLVVECAEELSQVNTVLKEEVAAQDQPTGVEAALEKSEVIEGKVQTAADKLAVVNLALEAEVKKRRVLEQRLLAVTQDEALARHAAFHDALTGLPNRALFDNRLEHGLAQAKRHGWTLAVMFMDLDNFKMINDQHGHDVGDAVLKVIAERLRQSTREDDTVSRHGGDEFLYLLMEVGGSDDVMAVAEKIVNSVQAPCLVSIGQLIVKPSIGISIFPKNGMTGLDLIKNADRAMYEAKQSGAGYAFAQ